MRMRLLYPQSFSRLFGQSRLLVVSMSMLLEILGDGSFRREYNNVAIPLRVLHLPRIHALRCWLFSVVAVSGLDIAILLPTVLCCPLDEELASQYVV
jgi:hypothetical protein